MVSCAYCSKMEPLPYQCNLCMKHYCSVHKLPQSHECTHYTGSNDSLKTTDYEVRTSHEELPYFIHAKSNVPYLVGREGHTVVAVELKKFGWSIRLDRRNDNMKDIVASKNDERWRVMVKIVDAKLSEALHSLPINAVEIAEFVTIAEREKVLPVIAIVASDSAVMLSAKTFRAVSPN